MSQFDLDLSYLEAYRCVASRLISQGMRTMSHTRHYMSTAGTILIVTALASVVFFVGERSTVEGIQQQKRLVHRLPIEEAEPIIITRITEGGNEIAFDEAFAAPDDWLRTLIITIKNRSTKPILYASLGVRFPRPPGSSSDRISVTDMFYGNQDLVARIPTEQEKMGGLMPGQSAQIQFTSDRFAYIPQFLAETGYPPTVTKIDVKISSVIFADDTMWSGGRLRERDPKIPGLWSALVQPNQMSRRIYLTSMIRRAVDELMKLRPPAKRLTLTDIVGSSSSDRVERLFAHAKVPYEYCREYHEFRSSCLDGGNCTYYKAIFSQDPGGFYDAEADGICTNNCGHHATVVENSCHRGPEECYPACDEAHGYVLRRRLLQRHVADPDRRCR